MKTPRYQQAIDFVVQEWHAEIKRLQGLIASLTGNEVTQSKTSPKAKTKVSAATQKAKKGKRTRRTSEDVRKQAMEMSFFIKSRGTAGAKSSEITAKFGKVLPSIREFINNRVDAKNAVKTKGAGSKTTYHVA